MLLTKAVFAAFSVLCFVRMHGSFELHSQISDDQKESPCCSLTLGSDFSRNDVILRSSLDGKFSAIDPRTGKVLWIRATGPGPLLSSSISDLELRADGKSFRLVPSLDGTLFRFTGDSVEALPFNADSLLESSLQVADDTIITGGKEVRTYGVGLTSGRLHYVCTLRGCSKFEGPRDVEEDVLVVKRNTQTIRAVSPLSGIERWNFSVGLHDVSFPAKTAEAEEQQPAVRDHEYDVHDPDDELESPVYQFDVGKGKIFAVSQQDNRILWEQRTDSPIVGAWMIRKGRLSAIDLFPRNPRAEFEPYQLYLGEHRGTPYIQTNHRWSSYIPSASSLVPVEWRPLNLLRAPLTLEHLYQKPVFVTHEEDRRRALAKVHPWLEYPYNGGFYVWKDLENLEYPSGELASEDEYEFDPVDEAYPDERPQSQKLPRRRRPKETLNETSSFLDDEPFGWLVYFHELSYYWVEFLIVIVVAAVVSWAVALWIRAPSAAPFRLLTPCDSESNQVVSINSARDREPVVNVNIQNLVMNIRHGPQSASSSERSDDNSRRIKRSKSSSETVTSPSQGHSTGSTSSSSQDFKSKFVEEFEDVEMLGAGGFGVVFKATHKIDCRDYAVKRIQLPSKKEHQEKVLREVRALAALDHSNIVRYFHTWLEQPPPDWKPDFSIRCVGSDGYTVSEPKVSNQSTEGDEEDSDESTFDSCAPVEDEGQEDDDDSIVFADDVNESVGFSEDVNANVESKKSTSLWDLSLATNSPAETGVASPADFRAVYHRRNVTCYADSVTVDDYTVEVRSDRPGCQALVPVSEFSDPRQLFQNLMSGDCDLSPRLKHPSSAERHGRKRAFSESATPKPPRVFLYIKMQLCQKETLKHWLANNSADRRPPKPMLLQMFSSVVDAVAYIHSQGLIHRDLKPSNIFFAPDGRLKVGDFGLVTTMCEDVEKRALSEAYDVVDESGDQSRLKLQALSSPYTNEVGTKLYMSPEQIAMKPYDSSVDVYSLGLILFELLVPLSTDMERQDLLSKLKSNLLFPAVFDSREMLEERKLLEKMLSHRPPDRPKAAEVLRCVQEWLLLPANQSLDGEAPTQNPS